MAALALAFGLAIGALGCKRNALDGDDAGTVAGTGHH